MYLNKSYVAEKVQEVPHNAWQAAFENYEPRKDDEKSYARGNAA
jgi:hypothetical protein